MDFELSTEWLGRVLAHLPEFVLVVDRERIIRYINRVEPGYDPDEVVGMESTSVLFPESRDDLNAALDNVFDEGEVAHHEVRAELADGSEAWYGGEITPLIEGDEVVGAIIRADNITELKAVKRELENVKRLLPVCAWCGRIRTEDGDWETVTAYLDRVSDTKVSHGLCESCEREQMEALDAG